MNNERIQKYNAYRDEILKRKKELEAMISHVDLEEQDILHFLENEKYNAVIMAKTTKRLITLRKERRAIKEEWVDINWIASRMQNELPERKFHDYKYRTNIMEEIKEAK